MRKTRVSSWEALNLFEAQDAEGMNGHSDREPEEGKTQHPETFEEFQEDIMGVAAHLRHAAQKPMRQDLEGSPPIEGAGLGGAVQSGGVFARKKLKAFHAVLELCKGTLEIGIPGNGQ